MVNISTRFCLAQERGTDTRIAQLVFHLAYLYQKVLPPLVIIGEQVALAVLLRHGQVGAAVGVLPSLEIAEIGFAQELVPAVACFLEALPGEDVLFVQGIALAKCLCQCGEQPGVLIIAVDVGGELLHRILDAQDGGIFSGLGVEDTDALHVLNGEINFSEHAFALASRAECFDRDGHACQKSRECQ